MYHSLSFSHPPQEVGVRCFLNEETQALRDSATFPRGPQESGQARGFRSHQFQNPCFSPSLNFLRPQFLHLQYGNDTSPETGWSPVTHPPLELGSGLMRSRHLEGPSRHSPAELTPHPGLTNLPLFSQLGGSILPTLLPGCSLLGGIKCLQPLIPRLHLNITSSKNPPKLVSQRTASHVALSCFPGCEDLVTPSPPGPWLPPQPNWLPKEALTETGLIMASPPTGRILHFLHSAKYFLSTSCAAGILVDPGNTAVMVTEPLGS